MFPDDHDVIKFSTTSVHARDAGPATESMNDAESKKFEQEFEEYQKKLKDQKDQWAKEHPDQVRMLLIINMSSRISFKTVKFLRLNPTLTSGTAGSRTRTRSCSRSSRASRRSRTISWS